ncbi:ATP-binding protein [Streptomyces sp. NPDC058469]|uniref:ATP-binding protein n=1 Tax=Streptomyces sp. NPDC058469 TaxID=3346514 RepID=UPI003647CBD0
MNGVRRDRLRRQPGCYGGRFGGLRRLAPRTLRGRLSLVALTTAALLMLVLTVAFNAVADHRLQHPADDELRTRAAAVATTVDTSGGTVRVLETSHDDLLDANVWIYAGPRLTAGVPPAHLERIVSPLLTNACRYARSTVTVRVYRAPGDAPDGVRLDVVDDRPGVPPPFAGQLFEPGRRADPGDGHGGAGLGLPLARRLARSAGGEVTYDPGHAPGARFVVALPSG